MKINLKMNLKKRAVLMIGGILCLALSINTAILTYISYKNYKEAILLNAVSMSNSLLKEINNVLSFGLAIENMEGLDAKLKNITSDETIGYAMVLDKNGNVLYHNNEDYIGKTFEDAKSLKTISADGMLIQPWENFYDISFPLLDAEGERIGVFRIGVESLAIKKQLYRLILWSVAVSLMGFLLFGAIIYFAIARFITDPIVEMEKVATRVSSGDLTEEVRLEGKDEIASLSASINNITSHLKNVLFKIGSITANVSSVAGQSNRSLESILGVIDLQKKSIEAGARHTSEMHTTNSSILRSAESLFASSENALSSNSQMTSSISQVAGSATVFNTTSQETASLIEEMVSSIKEVANSVNSLFAFSETSASNLIEVDTSAKEIQQNAKESVRLAENVSNLSSEQGLTSINKAIEGMNDIKEGMHALSGTIDRLDTRSEEIGSILKVVKDITDQTTLLSFNAAIQAAQAGEYGRSFSVVAEEIKSLAGRASESTREIAKIIAAVQEDTQLSVNIASQGFKSVEKGTELVGEVKKALHSIFESSVVSTDMAKMIQKSTAEQSRVIKEITGTIMQIMKQIKHISKATNEQMQGSSFILEAIDKIKTGSEQIMIATEEQSKSSKQLLEVAENVSMQAQQITSDIDNQKHKGDEIVSVMKKILETTEELVTSTKEMESGIGILHTDSQQLLYETQKFKI